MTTTLVRPAYFDVPAVSPPPGELLSVATIHEGAEWLEPSGLFESFNCIDTDSKAIWPCPAPSTLAAPTLNAPSTATSGGSIPAGTYRFVLTSLNARGETVKSNEVSQVTTGAASTITLTGSGGGGATGYRLYYTNGAAGSEANYISLAAGAISVTLTAFPPGGSNPGTPPASNTAYISSPKTFNSPAWVDGIRFAVYGGATCKGPGVYGDIAKLRAAFLAGESIGVERALMQVRFTTPAATDLTPTGGAVDPTVGLALLENDAACKYVGVPTIHSPRGITTLMARNGAVMRIGDSIQSVNGSKIASGGGYACPNNGPTGAAPAAGEMWLYASGEVVLARGDIVEQQAIDQSTNDIVSLVERNYVAAVDCYTAAVRVKVA